MPKFFRHVGPKVSRAIATKRLFMKSSAGCSVDEPRLLAASEHQRSVLSKIQESLALTKSKASGDVYRNHSPRPEDYVVDDEVNATPESRFDQLRPLPDAMLATRRNDLESAHCGNERGECIPQLTK
ncbi:MAG: hypothetical protein Q9191_002739 [Dirinaria sp. TL-2023a]